MAQATKTRAQLITDYGDNTTGAISPEDLRNGLVSWMGCYAHLYTKTGSTAQATIDTTFAKITGWATAGVADDAVPSAANDRITATSAGDYLVAASLAFSGTSSETFTFNIHVDQSEGVIQTIRKIGTAGDVGTTVCFGILTLTAGQQLEVYCKSAAGSGDSITMQDCHFVAVRIG